METIILERAVKYDDPPDFRQALVQALGAIGTSRSLDPLIGFMASATAPTGDCARAIAAISMRIGDDRAVDDIAAQYRLRPRRRGMGLPEEQLKLMPPFPQVQFIGAFSQIGGAKAVKALEELLAEETDPPLIARLRDTHAKVRERMIKERSQEPATPEPQD